MNWVVTGWGPGGHCCLDHIVHCFSFCKLGQGFSYMMVLECLGFGSHRAIAYSNLFGLQEAVLLCDVALWVMFYVRWNKTRQGCCGMGLVWIIFPNDGNTWEDVTMGTAYMWITWECSLMRLCCCEYVL
jgi:hypothetical protein